MSLIWKALWRSLYRIHDYDVLDNRAVYFTARRLLEDARKYVGSVYRYLSSAVGGQNK